MLALTAISTGFGICQGIESSNAQAKAQRQAKASADKALLQGQQDMNRANAKHPDTNAIVSAAQQAGKSGGSSTLLTGAGGVDPGSLTLGKSTLLGS